MFLTGVDHDVVLHDGAFSRRQGAVRALVDLRFGGVG